MSPAEAYSTLNMGFGCVAVVAEADADRTVDIARKAGHRAFVAGEVVGREVRAGSVARHRVRRRGTPDQLTGTRPVTRTWPAAVSPLPVALSIAMPAALSTDVSAVGPHDTEEQDDHRKPEDGSLG
ncbi:AIR synthase-related protein [Streptomyces halstedii]|uniref:AIR synthase-related protein n=2 Tax=Streptomyces halstedii TaxID=1944 RepID=UPI0036AC0F96